MSNRITTRNVLLHCFRSPLSKNVGVLNFQIPANQPKIFEHQKLPDLRYSVHTVHMIKVIGFVKSVEESV